MNTPSGYFCLFSYLIFLILIVFSLFSFFSYLLSIQSPHFTFLSENNYFRSSNDYLYISLGLLDIIVPPIYNNSECVRPIQFPYHHLQYRNRLVYSHIFRFTYAALMFTCCFFYLTMTGNNISIISLSLGGNSPPIYATKVNPPNSVLSILYRYRNIYVLS